MVSLTGFNGRFTPNWRISLLALLAMFLFIRLGVWQVERGQEKKQMLVNESTLATQPPTAWQPGDPLPSQYQPLTVSGRFLGQVLLLDNQHYHHQFGYDVLSPLLLSDNRVVLVDRGWVAGDATRHTMPVVKVPTGITKLRGSAYFPSKKNMLLGEVLEKKQADLAIVELIDPEAISQFLHKSVNPFIIRLHKDERDGYTREWAVVSMQPQRHYAYAVQWFAFALIIFILFIALNIKTKS